MMKTVSSGVLAHSLPATYVKLYASRVLNRSGLAGTHFDQPVGLCSRYRPYDLNSQIGSHDTVWVRWMLGRDRN